MLVNALKKHKNADNFENLPNKYILHRDYILDKTFIDILVGIILLAFHICHLSLLCIINLFILEKIYQFRIFTFIFVLIVMVL